MSYSDVVRTALGLTAQGVVLGRTSQALTIPAYGKPTWAIINLDSSNDIPLMGQFDPDVSVDGGGPMWTIKPGIAGGNPWMRFIGSRVRSMKFTFHAIADNILDQYPETAWKRLQSLASLDATLGRPPKIMFVHGQVVTHAFITDVPGDVPYKFWPNTRTIREIGPAVVTLTMLPGTATELSISTNYVVKEPNTSFEVLSKSQYGDPRYSHSLMLYNQKVKDGETVEIPRKSHPSISQVVELSVFFDPSDVIEGL